MNCHWPIRSARIFPVVPLLIVAFFLIPAGVAQEVGRVIRVDDVTVFSQPVGPRWLPKLTTIIQQAGYTCPRAQQVKSIGKSSMGEEYEVSCGPKLLHEITLGPGENDVGVVPKTDEAYETPLGKRVPAAADNELELDGRLVIYKKPFGKIFAPESWQHKFRSSVSSKPLRDEMFQLSLLGGSGRALDYRLQNCSISKVTVTKLEYIIFTPEVPMVVKARETDNELTLAPGDYVDITTDTPRNFVGQLSVSVEYCVSCPRLSKRSNYVLKME